MQVLDLLEEVNKKMAEGEGLGLLSPPSRLLATAPTAFASGRVLAASSSLLLGAPALFESCLAK